MVGLIIDMVGLIVDMVGLIVDMVAWKHKWKRPSNSRNKGHTLMGGVEPGAKHFTM